MLCSACGHANPDSNKFCGECAAPLRAAAARPVAEERKVVTALFCDLVGFTAASESADPEDINTMLEVYSSMARTQIENHGGVVQKFIGDAVVGVFGVPAAHEDDPERSVRAGLRIVEAAEELEAVGGAPLRLRVGINTGEALVRLGVSPSSGEGFLTGDAINTASRLQSAAPEMGVAVGLATYEATEVVFDYRELESATVKGKAQPVRMFQPIAPRARFGTDLTRTHTAPFVGREIDLALLKGIFDKSVASESVQLAMVQGEPGLGKSRLVGELFRYIDDRPGLTTWRQGRCLPYGEAVTFWAVGEIVKAHAGILDSDPPATAVSKLEAVLPAGEERAWFRQRLMPLLGMEASSPAEREELFTAWRRFLEHIAEAHPTVLVFEDLHWADETLLAFLEHLADRAEAVPLLVVGTARPELYEQYPDFAGRLRNVNAINLTPLSEPETARLVSALLDASVMPAELQQPILARAEGNPLYAEEYVRLLQDRDLLVRSGASWELREGAEVPFPDSVRALIAARLDTLTPDAKSLLADASVVGKVFWAGAIAEMGGRALAEVTDALRELSRKELVRLSRRSSIEGEAEYSFWHILTSDVAYAQLPRASRAARHVAAARWIESRAPERIEDMSDVLAYHYATALELSRAAGDSHQADSLEDPARRFLTLAGERALGLDTQTALHSFERALALTSPGHPDRPAALVRVGEAAMQAGRITDAVGPLEEAIRELRRRGDLAEAARAMNILADVLFRNDDPGWAKLPYEALALVEPLPPGPAGVAALTEVARSEFLRGTPTSALESADRALALADALGLQRSPRTLGYRGFTRASMGDAAGIDDIREAIPMAIRAGQAREVGILHNNLAITLWMFAGPKAALDELSAGDVFSRARGLDEVASLIAGTRLDPLIDVGEFDQALDTAATLTAWLEAEGPADLLDARAAQARVHSMRGQATQVAEGLEWIETTAREAGSTDSHVIGLGAIAQAHAALNDKARATAALRELAAAAHLRVSQYYIAYLPALARVAIALDDAALCRQLAAGLQPRCAYAQHSLTTVRAILAETEGHLDVAAAAYGDAAARWQQFEVVPERAHALYGQGRCLMALGRVSESTSSLGQARTLFADLGAAPWIAEIDALHGEETALSS
jgi:class 3 adenylate cyclase/tetratricopeptide (TPR) repeat protein